MNILECYNNWAKIDVNVLVLDTIEANQELIIDTITEKQLFQHGEDGNGEKLPLPYAEKTQMIKRAKGQPIDRITLKDTGDFYASMVMVRQADSVRTYFTDYKSDRLYKDWGAEIGSISKRNLGEIVDSDIKEDFIRSLREKLNL